MWLVIDVVIILSRLVQQRTSVLSGFGTFVLR